MSKQFLSVFILILAAFVMIGCEEDNNIVIDEIPAAPQGVFSVTGDGAVYIYWNSPYEEDIDGFAIYRSNEATTGYVEIDFVAADPNPNLDLLIYEYIDDGVVNGNTYYYAVASVDNANQVSDLSAEDVFDTPRPEGTATLFDMAVQASGSGMILDTIPAVVAWDNPLADVYVDSDINGVLYLNAANLGVDIQDMGYTESFDDVGWAPEFGWSENGWVELIEGHTYVVWDDDSFYAKIRVELKGSTGVSIRWAFQLDNNNPELIAPQLFAPKPVHSAQYLKKQNTSTNQ